MQYIKDHPKQGKWKLPQIEQFPGWDWYMWGSTTGREYPEPTEDNPRHHRSELFEPTKNNFIFIARVKLGKPYHGRSSAGFIFIDCDDESIEYCMTLHEAGAFLKKALLGEVEVLNGEIESYFTFKKSGTQYSIVPWEGEV